jgi:hypothetical protein
VHAERYTDVAPLTCNVRYCKPPAGRHRHRHLVRLSVCSAGYSSDRCAFALIVVAVQSPPELVLWVAALTRARGGRAEPGDLLEPPRRRCDCWSTSPFLFLLFADSCSGDDGARAIGAVDDAAAADAAALNDHRNLAALTILAAPTRARGARRFEQALRQTDLLERPGRLCGFWSTSPFLFSGLLFADSGSGPTMELRRSLLTSASSGRWRWCRRQCRALSPDFPAGARGLYPLARG